MTLRLVAVLLLLSISNPALGQQDERAEPLDLKGLLEIALEHDGRILAEHARLGAYRARYDQARWAWFPTVKLSALFGGPVGERKLACPDDPTCVRLKSDDPSGLGNLSEQVSFAVGGKLEAAMPIYTFGKISEAKRAAKAGVDVGLAGIDRARQEVALEVRRAWHGWLLACSAVEILEDGERRIREAEKKLLEMLEELNEEVTDRDLFKLRYHASEVRAMLVEARKGKQVALAALRFLTGVEELGRARPLAEAELERPEIRIGERRDYLRRAGELRPELKMLAGALRAARAAVEVCKAHFYPDFFVAGYFEGSYSPAHDYIENSLLNRGLTYYTGGLGLGFQLTLDIPQKMARLEQAEAELHRVEIQQQQALAAVGLQIDERLLDLEAARQNSSVLRKGRRAAKAWMRSNFMSYGVGIANTKDLLDSIAAFAKSRLDRDRAAHDTLLARDRLDAAVGEDLGVVR